ncbi:hypothetical protein CANARDRAFT_202839 [[Candida] arabinofermentans NRRL YB-2248]|uniref:Sister chromatid cohesion protein PDS5 n=1 Tax=[Candida] arabinofermentans NRRL YB-2248 TaxID=983967 RepID=A0A1E4SVN7_9ASCO|nr:hypothetical protein CANARDRAFT_202839 [[Candida] arabinofermentans NRRL YB-2248]
MAVTKGLQRLKINFKDNIISTFNKPIATKDLLTRLSNLSSELSSLDQDKIDIASSQPQLDAIKDNLINKKLTKHSNSGVQALVSCCLADILRLYAPDAPYNASQLSDLFKLFFDQFKRLDNQDDPYHHQHIYLLKRLVETRSIVLITDLPNSQQLIESIFDISYTLISSTDLNSQIEPLFVDVLTEVISESSSIPNKTLKLILNKFLNNSRAAQTKGTSVQGFQFTLDICKNNIDRMSRMITQFFSEIVYEGTQQVSNNKENDQSIMNDHTLTQLKKLHKLSIEVWKHVPELLSSVMGLIDNELEAADERIRISATETIGQIISFNQSRINFVTSHGDTYLNWIKKPLDRSPQVRSTWVKSTGEVLIARSDVVNDITKGLMKTLVDSDEKVRLVTVKQFLAIPPEIFLQKVANEAIMSTLSQLVREKHADIRNSSLSLLGTLYSSMFDKLYQGDEKLDKLVSWIPDDIFKLIYINDRSINAQVDFTLFEKIFPLESDSSKRTNRLLTIFSNLSDKGKSSFFAVVKRQQQLAGAVSQLLTFADQYNVDNLAVWNKIDKIVSWFTTTFPVEFNSRNSLTQFVNLNNKRFFRLLKLCTSVESDYDTIHNCMQELFAKLSDSKNIKITTGESSQSSVSPFEMLNTIKLLTYRSSLITYNQSNVVKIMNISKDLNSKLSPTAIEILDNISSVVPAVLKANISTLVESCIIQFDHTKKSYNDKDLKAVYHFSKRFPEMPLYSEDQKDQYFDNLRDLALRGTPLEAKYSLKILGTMKNDQIGHKEKAIKDIVMATVDNELNIDDEDLNTKLSTIAELFLIDYSLVEANSKKISSFLASKILLRNRTTGSEETDTNEPELDETEVWISDNDLLNSSTDCNSKLLALRIFVNWLKAVSGTENSGKTAEPIMKLLNSILASGGEIVSSKSDTYPTPKTYQARLRLEAGIQLLKLAKYPKYNQLILQPTINKLIYLVQDENSHVRSLITAKLKKYLSRSLISERFLPLVFFLAHEPNPSLKQDTSTWIRSTFKRKHQATTQRKNDLLFERSFVRFLHMLSHHDEFLELTNLPTQYQAISFALIYITFTLDLMATQDNISVLYYLTTRIKQHRDKLQPSPNILPESLFMLSDLTQLVVKRLTKHRNWNLVSWPGKLHLPTDLFARIEDEKLVREISTTLYIPDGIMKDVDELVNNKTKSVGKTPVKRIKRRKNVESDDDGATPRKKKMSSSSPVPQRRSAIKRRRVNYNYDNVDSTDHSESDDDEDDH